MQVSQTVVQSDGGREASGSARDDSTWTLARLSDDDTTAHVVQLEDLVALLVGGCMKRGIKFPYWQQRTSTPHSHLS